MLQALDKLAPGVFSRHTLLYGVEVKFYSNRIEVSQEMETKVKNLYAIGDGAGITRGLLQASTSGVIAARTIVSRIQGKHKTAKREGKGFSQGMTTGGKP
jgi:hypothetical protein